MISAVSKNGAASSAKRIMSTAPMAKLGAMRQLERVNADAQRGEVVLVKPVVPTTAWTPCAAHQARFARAAVQHREVDGDLRSGLVQCGGVRRRR